MPITIGQVANVTIGPAVPIGDATIMGRPGVLVTVSSQFGANTLKATEAVERALEDLKPALERRGIDVILLHRPASFIERALSNLEHALALGSALILIVLYAFLRSWKAALISFLAIPLSLLAAIFVLAEFGQTLNTMTLGGFALALGVLVDDAIIDIENIMRRLRLAKAAGRDDDLQTIEEASIEIRGSMLYGTLAVIFVFLPILFAGGVQGRFIGPMALTFIIAVLASMVVALTVTPALCALMLTGEETKEPPRLVTLMQGFQAWCMEKVRTRWGLTVAALAGAAAAAIAVAPFLHSELIPQFREGHFVIQMTAAAQGTSVGDISATGIRISNELLKLPFVRAVGHQIGRAEAGEDTWSPDKSEFHVELTAEHDETETEAQEKIREVLEHFPEVRTEAMTFLGDRISETLSGETAQVVINLIGPRSKRSRAPPKWCKRPSPASRASRTCGYRRPPRCPRWPFGSIARRWPTTASLPKTRSTTYKRHSPARPSGRRTSAPKPSMSSSFCRPISATASSSSRTCWSAIRRHACSCAMSPRSA